MHLHHMSALDNICIISRLPRQQVQKRSIGSYHRGLLVVDEQNIRFEKGRELQNHSKFWYLMKKGGLTNASLVDLSRTNFVLFKKIQCAAKDKQAELAISIQVGVHEGQGAVLRRHNMWQISKSNPNYIWSLTICDRSPKKEDERQKIELDT